jgi:hypothetical protein
MKCPLPQIRLLNALVPSLWLYLGENVLKTSGGGTQVTGDMLLKVITDPQSLPLCFLSARGMNNLLLYMLLPQ